MRDVLKISRVLFAMALAMSAGATFAASPQYVRVKRIDPYLYEAWYTNYQQEVLSPHTLRAMACSGVRKGNFYGRNLDLFFLKIPNIVVHMSPDPAAGRLASIGVAVNPKIEELGTNDLARGVTTLEQKYPREMNAIPDVTLTGINERGVAVGINVVPVEDLVSVYRETDPGFRFKSTPEGGLHPGQGLRDLYFGSATRYLLDGATNAVHAVEMLDRVNLFGVFDAGNGSMQSAHLMISDPQMTLVTEFGGPKMFVVWFDAYTNVFGEAEVRSLSKRVSDSVVFVHHPGARPIMTNWWLAFGDDTTTVSFTNRMNHAEGVERYRVLNDRYGECIGTPGSMRDLMKAARFSRIVDDPYTDPYYPFTDLPVPPRPSHEDFISDAELMKSVTNDVARFRRIYSTEDRTTDTWITTHCAVIDIADRSFTLNLYEDWQDIYAFRLQAGGLLTNYWQQVVRDKAELVTDFVRESKQQVQAPHTVK